MRLAALLLALLVWSALAFAQGQSSLEMAIKLAREHGYRAQHVEWTAVETKAYQLAGVQGEEAAIRFVLNSLRDGHSFYQPPQKPDPTNLSTYTTILQPIQVLSEVKASVEGVPVIQVNSWSGPQKEAVVATALLRRQLVRILAKPKCGVIVDFSNNTGGNMWPMLVGLSPLLTEGVLGQFKSVEGRVAAVEKHGDKIRISGSDHVLNTATELQYTTGRIAVIIGPKSASSGEIVPIMFHGQDNVRLFGRRTSGLSTANSAFPLPNGGFAYITTGVTLDRHGRIFDAHVEPEIVTEQPLLDAAQWVTSKCQLE